MHYNIMWCLLLEFACNAIRSLPLNLLLLNKSKSIKINYLKYCKANILNEIILGFGSHCLKSNDLLNCCRLSYSNVAFT